MKKKQLIYWISLVMGMFLLAIGGGNFAKADTAANVDSAIVTGVKLTAQKDTLDAWDAAILATSDGGITDAQADNAYQDIVTTNGFLSGNTQNLSGVSNVAGVIGLRALDKDPANVEKKDLVGQVINDPQAKIDKPSLYTLVNDLEALSTGSYGKTSEAARATLTAKILADRDATSGIWTSTWGDVDLTGRAIQALSMNMNQPGVPAAIQKAVTVVENNYYQQNGGFGNKTNQEDQYNNITMVNALAAAGVDVYTSLNGKPGYVAPVQRLLDQKDISADSNSMLLQQATYTLEQARFTKDGGQGWIFDFAKNPTFRPRELAQLNAAANTKQQAINNDSQASAGDKATAINTINQTLENYITKINADTTSEAAIADRAVGVAEMNNVKVVDSSAESSSATTINNNYTTIINSTPSASSPSAASSSSTTTTVTKPTTTKKSKSAKGSVVYGLTTLKLYKSTNFTKHNLAKTYKKQHRTNRPMFLVLRQVTSKQGHAVYRVKDMKSGKTGYMLSARKYLTGAYYSAKVTRVKVINPKGINESNYLDLTNKKQHVKKNKSLSVQKVVGYGHTTRLLLTNGRYISANKKLVMATKIAKTSGQNTDTVETPVTPAPSTSSSSSSTTTSTSTSTTTNPAGTSSSTSNGSNNTPTNGSGNNSSNSGSNTNPTTETVTVSVNANGSVIASGSVTVSKGATALDALNTLAAQHGLSITTVGSGITAYVKGINGYNAGPAGTMTGWLYSINGNQPNTSIGAYVVANGDRISLNYNK
ncbi:DUF5776 domain-containing protein [Lentilactobacillus otakiensis]|uniref:DUF4430 domain-containing protein n=2 Tax=Lentilactobacillus otakiensis TaxID=481720 RepID=S4NM21_9LACO|nr:DUF5776 domain-containing protein [Lentilactobacillus otakiensis]KRL11459.1 hypothetical protein FD05_GL002092 [Lentilactobacillus otakiensis DSM 19908 = JCM 15040]MBZ3776918.1 DUF5776 domain-containing protein [Lentilactobacillus otakiensis]GAD16946.1 conserved hypothetical protein [Lentilactobacillus otakiensis DSM 19908 = JCM 15040]